MSYSQQRQANIDNFSTERVKNYESDSLDAILTGSAKSVLQSGLPDRAAVFKTEQLGDHKLPNYGLDNFLPDKADVSPEVTKKGLKYMDFACGTGLLVKKLAPYLSDATIVGIDISDAQVAAFNERVPEIGKINPSLKVEAFKYDIIDQKFDADNGLKAPAQLQQGTFDLITTTLSFHHFSELEKIVTQLKSYLKVGGKLVIVDMYDHKDEYIRDHVDTNSPVAHHGGFSPAQIQEKLAPIHFTKVESQIKYLYEHWCSETNLRNHLPLPAVEKALKSAPTRQRVGSTEYLVSRTLVLTICTK